MTRELQELNREGAGYERGANRKEEEEEGRPSTRWIDRTMDWNDGSIDAAVDGLMDWRDSLDGKPEKEEQNIIAEKGVEKDDHKRGREGR